MALCYIMAVGTSSEDEPRLFEIATARAACCPARSSPSQCSCCKFCSCKELSLEIICRCMLVVPVLGGDVDLISSSMAPYIVPCSSHPAKVSHQNLRSVSFPQIACVIVLLQAYHFRVVSCVTSRQLLQFTHCEDSAILFTVQTAMNAGRCQKLMHCCSMLQSRSLRVLSYLPAAASKAFATKVRLKLCRYSVNL